jgi:large subunit ribosomal protein L22
MKAVAKSLRISPRKANLVAELVRGKGAKVAIELLQRVPKKGAKFLEKVLSSAVANAEHNFSQDGTVLYIAHILVTKGPTYKRARPISRGRSAPILKRTSHIFVELRAQ